MGKEPATTQGWAAQWPASSRMLDNRYLIQEKVGGGGMATVYKAEDTLLHRHVAVKILRQQFAGDEDFVTHFRQEAQTGASLSHPNIVAIYDVGKADEIDYIVMEFVDGRTVKDLIRAEGPLPVPEALRIAIQVADALEYAHQHHMVHRDIKPHNLLITPDGRVKVTDFGIARAMSGTTLVHTGTIVGSAHYFSPEQARGSFIDKRSDLYALGVVLYEMLTGDVPFQAESPISVALKHLQEKPPALRQKRYDVPQAVQDIVERAMQKEPVQRYGSAAELRADMARALEKWQKGERPPLPQHLRRRRLTVAVTGVVFLLLLLGYGAYRAAMSYLNVPVVTVPRLAGLPLAAAQSRLQNLGLSGQVAGNIYSSVAAGAVARTSPAAGEQVRQALPIELYLSRGPQPQPVPALTGMNLSQAQSILSGEGLHARATYRNSGSVPSGNIISQKPVSGRTVPQGGTVDLVVSRGPSGQATLPDLTGKSLAQAQQTLKHLNLVIGNILYGKSNQPQGTVIAEKPRAGTRLAPGSTVSLTLSPGGGGSTSGAPQGTTQRQVVLIDVTNTAPNTQVTVMLVDQNGQHPIYNQPVPLPPAQISLQVTWVGTGKLQVYFNGNLIATDPLPLSSQSTGAP